MQVQNSDVEGDCQIKQVQCIRYSRTKGLIYILTCILTMGIVWILGYWLLKLKCKLLYKKSNVDECTHFLVQNWDDEWEIVRKEHIIVQKDESTFMNTVGMKNRLLYYYYDPISKVITPVEFPLETSLQRELYRYKTLKSFVGIKNYETHKQARQCYRECQMNIPTPSYAILILDQIVHPFFLFQLYSVILWIYEEYIYFGTMIVIMSTYSLITDVYLLRKKSQRLATMVSAKSNLHEYITYGENGGVPQLVSSTSLVCGTIIYVTENLNLPCDCVILEGDCLVDESALTGEKIPVVKVKVDAQPQQNNISKKNILYEGTTVVQVNRVEKLANQIGIRCLVIATNFQTAKGQLIRSILYPKPHKFSFFTQSIHFLLILGLITILGFIILLPQLIWKDEASAWQIIIILMDSITITIPPTLPAAMNFGIKFAIDRLAQNQIYCIQPPKIIVSGRLDTICFDKTGTLTENKMVIKEIILNQNESHDQVELLSLDCMICCQSLIKIRREVHEEIIVKSEQLQEEKEPLLKLIGDPIEVQMFEHANGEIEALQDMNEYCQKVFRIQRERRTFMIRKKFDFTSDNQRMTVIAENKNTKQNFIFMKGAPEIVKSFCNEKSLNPDFDDIFIQNTQKGLRIIALAFKPISLQEIYAERVQLEKNLNFLWYETVNQLTILSFAVFDNILKPEAPDVIKQLKDADIDCKIITGDSMLTAFYVASKCEFLQNKKTISFIDHINDKLKITQFNSIEDCQIHLQNQLYPNEDEIQTTNNNSQIESFRYVTYQNEINIIDKVLEDMQSRGQNLNLQIFITGTAFELIFLNNQYYNKLQEPMDIQCNEQKFDLFKQLVSQTIILARMKPSQKINFIDLLQKCDKTVGMVGDGGNDAGALKQADIGVDLSETETSIYAPFTSKDSNIKCVLTILRNGRAALSTNFQCFKFMALYSLIQYASTILLSLYSSELSDMEFLYIDLFIICPVFMTMALTEPYEKLSKTRPPSSLFTLQCMVSVFGQVILQTIAQISLSIMLLKKNFSDSPEGCEDKIKSPDDLLSCTPQSTTNFVFTNFLYVASIMAFSASKPFKKPFYTNKNFTGCIISIWILNILMTFFKWARLPKLMFYDDLSKGWLLFVIFYAHVWSLIFYIWENVVCSKWLQFRDRYKKVDDTVDSDSFQSTLQT